MQHSLEIKNKILENFFTNEKYDARKWRNASIPEIKNILDSVNNTLLSEKIYTILNGHGECRTCGSIVKLISFNAGWKNFCSRSCAQKNNNTRNKAIETMKLKYNGASNIWEIPGYSDIIKEKISKTKKSRNINYFKSTSSDIKLIDDENTILKHSCGYEWKQDILRLKTACPKCTSSKPEEEIIEFIKELGINNIKRRDRKILYPKEIDILLPDLNFGIEYNGVYWHRDSSPTLSQSKTITSGKKNIKLFTILETDWVHNKESVKEKIKSYIIKTVKIGARKTKIRIIEKKEAVNFFKAYHFDGNSAFNIAIGLYYNDELIMVCSFGKNRFSKNKNDWEIIRFASKHNITVVGGLSKIIKCWEELKLSNRLITFHNLKFGWTTNLEKIGFKLENITRPGWRWVKGNTYLERWQCQKKKLKIFKSYNDNKTENEIMVEEGWIKEYNLGNMKWAKLV